MPGLVGEIAQFIYDAAPRQNKDVALSGALVMLAGVTGRTYVTPTGAGLNIYLLLLAVSGTGKDAVSSASGKLFGKVKEICPSIMDFRGPGELASAPALVKWLAKHPCVFCILGEIGLQIQMMAAPNASANLKGLKRALLQLYSKSGRGQFFDAMAYSDNEKNVEAQPWPSLTIFGETAPESLEAALDEGLIAGGFVPRAIVWRVKGQRAYLNEDADAVEPSPRLIQLTADVAAYCLSAMQRGQRHRVGWTGDAQAKFREFDKWTTDQINEAPGEAWRELWNRAHLNAMKLASLRAVGEHYLNPTITLAHTMWATELVVAQVRDLLAKLEAGDIGPTEGNQTKQHELVIWAVNDFFLNPDKFNKPGGIYPGEKTPLFINNFIIPEAHIIQKLRGYAAFRNDKAQANNAIKRTIKELVEADALREVPPQQLADRLSGYKPKSYVISDAKYFASRCS